MPGVGEIVVSLLTERDKVMLRDAGDRIRAHLTEGRRQAVADDLAVRMTRNGGPLSEPGRCQWCGAASGLVNSGLEDGPEELACRDEGACLQRGAALRPDKPVLSFVQAVQDAADRRIASAYSASHRPERPGPARRCGPAAGGPGNWRSQTATGI